jgi:uncharacterized membrane protein
MRKQLTYLIIIIVTLGSSMPASARNLAEDQSSPFSVILGLVIIFVFPLFMIKFYDSIYKRSKKKRDKKLYELHKYTRDITKKLKEGQNKKNDEVSGTQQIDLSNNDGGTM